MRAAQKAVLFLWFCWWQFAYVKGKRISLKDALNAMESKDAIGQPVPFSCVVVTYNSVKKTGGKFLELTDVVLSKNEIYSNSPGDGDVSGIAASALASSEPKAYAPNHSENMTRNVKILSSGLIRKFNIRLLIKFNNQDVVL